MRVLLVVFIFTVLAPSTGFARRSDTHAYPMDQIWSTVVRLLRVEYRFPIQDRDREIGYILFDYLHNGRSVPGSVELIPVEEHGLHQVRVTLHIPAMPSYVERMILDKLTRKLRNEYGTPLERPIEREMEEEQDNIPSSEEENELEE